MYYILGDTYPDASEEELEEIFEEMLENMSEQQAEDFMSSLGSIGKKIGSGLAQVPNFLGKNPELLSTIGGIAGNLILPGAGGMIGGALGSAAGGLLQNKNAQNNLQQQQQQNPNAIVNADAAKLNSLMQDPQMQRALMQMSTSNVPIAPLTSNGQTTHVPIANFLHALIRQAQAALQQLDALIPPQVQEALAENFGEDFAGEDLGEALLEEVRANGGFDGGGDGLQIYPYPNKNELREKYIYEKGEFEKATSFYEVKNGDTLSSIVESIYRQYYRIIGLNKFSQSQIEIFVDELRQLNGLPYGKLSNNLSVGQKLLIPNFYIVPSYFDADASFPNVDNWVYPDEKAQTVKMIILGDSHSDDGYSFYLTANRNQWAIILNKVYNYTSVIKTCMLPFLQLAVDGNNLNPNLSPSSYVRGKNYTTTVKRCANLHEIKELIAAFYGRAFNEDNPLPAFKGFTYKALWAFPEDDFMFMRYIEKFIIKYQHYVILEYARAKVHNNLNVLDTERAKALFSVLQPSARQGLITSAIGSIYLGIQRLIEAENLEIKVVGEQGIESEINIANNIVETSMAFVDILFELEDEYKTKQQTAINLVVAVILELVPLGKMGGALKEVTKALFQNAVSIEGMNTKNRFAIQIGADMKSQAYKKVGNNFIKMNRIETIANTINRWRK